MLSLCLSSATLEPRSFLLLIQQDTGGPPASPSQVCQAQAFLPLPPFVGPQ